MDYTLSCKNSRRPRSWSIDWRIILSKFGEGRGHPSCGNRSDLPTVEGRQKTELRLTEAHRPLEYCIEHRREITGRGVDDLQDLVGRSPLLQKLVAFGEARLQPLLKFSQMFEIGQFLTPSIPEPLALKKAPDRFHQSIAGCSRARAKVRIKSISTEMDHPEDVRFTSAGDRTEDALDRQLCANSGLMHPEQPPYSITSSASAVSVAGISSPIDFAVFRLTTNW